MDKPTKSPGRRPAGLDPRRLAVRTSGGVSTLLVGDAPAKTPGGHPVAHASERLVALIRREAEISRELDAHALSAYAQFATEVDFVRAGQDPVAANLERILAEEEPVLDRDEGRTGEEQQRCWSFLVAFLAAKGQRLPPGAPPPAEFTAFVRDVHGGLTPPQKTAVVMLYRTHMAGVLVPITFALGLCTPSEYAEALLAMHRAHPRIFDPDWKTFTDNFVIAREDASIVREYLDVTSEA